MGITTFEKIPEEDISFSRLEGITAVEIEVYDKKARS